MTSKAEDHWFADALYQDTEFLRLVQPVSTGHHNSLILKKNITTTAAGTTLIKRSKKVCHSRSRIIHEWPFKQ
jgi:hypothetical protein